MTGFELCVTFFDCKRRIVLFEMFCNKDARLTPGKIGGDMNKQVGPTGKKDYEPEGENDEIIDLEDRIDDNQAGSDSQEEEILDLTDEISKDEQESLQAGILELTEQLPPDTQSVSDPADPLQDDDDNVIHLSDMSNNMSVDEVDDLSIDTTDDFSLDGADDLEEIADEAITALDDDASEAEDGEDLAELTEQLESAMPHPFENDADSDLDKLPEANLIEIGAYQEKDEVDQFDLLPESEPGMADTIDAIDVGDLDEDTAFSDIEDDLNAEMAKLPNIKEESDAYASESADDDVTRAALDLSRAMGGEQTEIYAEDDKEEYNEEIDNIRTKLDKFFPEEGSTDPLKAFDPPPQKVEEEPKPDRQDMVIPPFEKEKVKEDSTSVEVTTPAANPFEIRAAPEKPKTDHRPNPFDGSINLYSADYRMPSEPEPPSEVVKESSETESITPSREISAAVEQLIEAKYGKKIEKMILRAIEKAVSREILKVKRAILDESDQLD